VDDDTSLDIPLPGSGTQSGPAVPIVVGVQRTTLADLINPFSDDFLPKKAIDVPAGILRSVIGAERKSLGQTDLAFWATLLAVGAGGGFLVWRHYKKGRK
jgi:hypothetical protein